MKVVHGKDLHDHMNSESKRTDVTAISDIDVVPTEYIFDSICWCTAEVGLIRKYRRGRADLSNVISDNDLDRVLPLATLRNTFLVEDVSNFQEQDLRCMDQLRMYHFIAVDSLGNVTSNRGLAKCSFQSPARSSCIFKQDCNWTSTHFYEQYRNMM